MNDCGLYILESRDLHNTPTLPDRAIILGRRRGSGWMACSLYIESYDSHNTTALPDKSHHLGRRRGSGWMACGWYIESQDLHNTTVQTVSSTDPDRATIWASSRSSGWMACGWWSPGEPSWSWWTGNRHSQRRCLCFVNTNPPAGHRSLSGMHI